MTKIPKKMLVVQKRGHIVYGFSQPATNNHKVKRNMTAPTVLHSIHMIKSITTINIANTKESCDPKKHMHGLKKWRRKQPCSKQTNIVHITSILLCILLCLEA